MVDSYLESDFWEGRVTKILNFALKIKGVVARVAHAKSSDPATPPSGQKKKQRLERALAATTIIKIYNGLSPSSRDGEECYTSY